MLILPEKFTQRNLVQVELESQGVCNLNCTYCYIPKNLKVNQKVNQDILNQIKDGSFLRYMKDLYGDQLEAFSFWGTEPTLNMPVYIKTGFIEELLKTFPRLKNFSLSTNLIYNFPKLKQYIEYMSEMQQKYNRKLRLNIQFSLDGDEKINEKNRGKGTTKLILDTLKRIQEYYKSDEFKSIKGITIDNHFKPTIDSRDIADFVNNYPDRFYETYEFFNEVIGWFNGIPSNVNFGRAVAYTLQLPGFYTNEDGIMFAQFIRYVHELMNDRSLREKCRNIFIGEQYTNRFLNVIRNYGSFNTDYSRGNSLLTCSGGDTMVGLDPTGRVGICHQYFFVHNKEYLDYFLNTDVKEMDGRYPFQYVKDLFEHYTPSIYDKYNLYKFVFQLRGYHDFYEPRVANVQMLAQTEQKFGGLQDKMLITDKKYLYLFSTFIQSQFSCPAENLLTTGIISTPSVSIIKIMGNGQFNQILRYLKVGYK